MNWAGIDRMIIINNKCKISADITDIVDQVYQNGFKMGRLRRLQQRQGGIAGACLQRLKPCDDIIKKIYRIVVTRVDREPGHRDLVPTNPVGHEGGFPETSRCGNKGKFSAKALVQTFKQARP